VEAAIVVEHGWQTRRRHGRVEVDPRPGRDRRRRPWWIWGGRCSVPS
jgi:hypothetical protein